MIHDLYTSPALENSTPSAMTSFLRLHKSPSSKVDGGESTGSHDPRLQERGHESPAQLNLQRVYEQSRRGIPKRDASKAAEPAPGLPIKGKPRLLLMGQRRCET
jgi:hypothetical protein